MSTGIITALEFKKSNNCGGKYSQKFTIQSGALCSNTNRITASGCARCSFTKEVTGMIQGRDFHCENGQSYAGCQRLCETKPLCKSIEFARRGRWAGQCCLVSCQIGDVLCRNNGHADYVYSACVQNKRPPTQAPTHSGETWRPTSSPTPLPTAVLINCDDAKDTYHVKPARQSATSIHWGKSPRERCVLPLHRVST